MNGVLTTLAIGSISLVVYSYVIYPVLLAFLAAVCQSLSDLRYLRNKQDRREPEPAQWPQVAVVISAYNEERHIDERVRNLFALDYPAELIRYHIGSDGSQDRTAEILKSFDDVRLCAYIVEQNRGKAAMLNDLRARVQAPIVIFSDANTYFDAQAVKRLVRWFAKPETGGVSGELRLLGSAGQNQDSLYWRMEQALKFFEGRIGGLLGANGAIYAVRRELWPELPTDTICDDFCIGMNVSTSGQGLVYDPSAWAEEDTPDNLDEEYRRRLRIGIGNFQALFRHPAYFTRTSAATRLAYISHKVLRWTGPHLMLTGLFASCVLAMNDPAWMCFALLQMASYAVAGAAYAYSIGGGALPKVLRLPALFFALNWAFLRSSWRYIRGTQQGSWQRTAR